MQHVFSHQQQYPSDTWSSQLPHHPNLHHGNNANPHPQHYNRLASNTNASNNSVTSDPTNFSVDNPSPPGAGNNGAPNGGAIPSAEERRVLQWIAQLMDPSTREAALLELSKKREQFPQLALILWHSFGEARSQT